MQWTSLVATALGAIIAFSGSTLAEFIRSRRDERRNRTQTKHQVAIDFILAANRAHGLLRRVAWQRMEPSQLEKAARDAVGNSGLYDAREQMLISAPPGMALATEKAFFSIMAIRDTIASSSRLDSPAYRQAQKVFDQAIWAVRQAAREDIGNIGLDLDKMIRVEASQTSSD
jgi:hypothetical protein